jgi:hypothetical protein
MHGTQYRQLQRLLVLLLPFLLLLPLRRLLL